MRENCKYNLRCDWITDKFGNCLRFDVFFDRDSYHFFLFCFHCCFSLSLEYFFFNGTYLLFLLFSTVNKITFFNIRPKRTYKLWFYFYFLLLLQFLWQQISRQAEPNKMLFQFIFFPRNYKVRKCSVIWPLCHRVNDNKICACVYLLTTSRILCVLSSNHKHCYQICPNKTKFTKIWTKIESNIKCEFWNQTQRSCNSTHTTHSFQLRIGFSFVFVATWFQC